MKKISKSIIFLLIMMFFSLSVFSQTVEKNTPSSSLILTMNFFLNPLKLGPDEFLKPFSGDITKLAKGGNVFITAIHASGRKRIWQTTTGTLEILVEPGVWQLKAFSVGYLPEEMKISISRDQTNFQANMVLKKWYGEYLDYLPLLSGSKFLGNTYFEYLILKNSQKERRSLRYLNERCLQDQWLLLNLGAGIGNLYYVDLDQNQKSISIKSGNAYLHWKYLGSHFGLLDTENLKLFALVGLFQDFYTIDLKSQFAHSLKLGLGINVFDFSAINFYGLLSTTGPLFASGYPGFGAEWHQRLYFDPAKKFYLGVNTGYSLTQLQYNVNEADTHRGVIAYHRHALWGELVFKHLPQVLNFDLFNSDFAVHAGVLMEWHKARELLDQSYSLPSNPDFENWSVYVHFHFPGLFF